MNKYLFVILCFIIFCFISCDINTTSDGLVWEENNGRVTIRYYTGPGGHLEIPAKINGKPVVEIGPHAFDTSDFETKGRGGSLTSVKLPNSVTRIGSSAFDGNQLTTINIPNSVTFIDSFAFSGNYLTHVTIPDNVTYLGAGVFHDNKLSFASLPGGLDQIRGSLFGHNKLTTIKIPESVTSIGYGAFDGNYLTAVIIPVNVTSIAANAFRSTSLISITIGENVTLETDNNQTAFDNGFDEVYNINGKQAGTYTRPDTNSIVWTKQE